MGDTAGKTVNLWNLIERMQLRLEALGLDRDTVDAAITRGLRKLLEADPARG